MIRPRALVQRFRAAGKVLPDDAVVLRFAFGEHEWLDDWLDGPGDEIASVAYFDEQRRQVQQLDWTDESSDPDLRRNAALWMNGLTSPGRLERQLRRDYHECFDAWDERTHPELVTLPLERLGRALDERGLALVQAQVSAFEGNHNDTEILAWCEPRV